MKWSKRGEKKRRFCDKWNGHKMHTHFWFNQEVLYKLMIKQIKWTVSFLMYSSDNNPGFKVTIKVVCLMSRNISTQLYLVEPRGGHCFLTFVLVFFLIFWRKKLYGTNKHLSFISFNLPHHFLVIWVAMVELLRNLL